MKSHTMGMFLAALALVLSVLACASPIPAAPTQTAQVITVVVQPTQPPAASLSPTLADAPTVMV